LNRQLYGAKVPCGDQDSLYDEPRDHLPYVAEFNTVICRLGPNNDYAGEGEQKLLITDPSSHQRGRPISTDAQLSDSSRGPQVGLDTKTDWLIDRRP
jgi:hypothetical protein